MMELARICKRPSNLSSLLHWRKTHRLCGGFVPFLLVCGNSVSPCGGFASICNHFVSLLGNCVPVFGHFASLFGDFSTPLW